MSIVVTLEFNPKQPDWRVNALKHCPTSLFCLKGVGAKELIILNYYTVSITFIIISDTELHCHLICFIYHVQCVILTGSRNAQIAYKALILGVSVRVFLEDIWFKSGDSVKISPCLCGWASSNPLSTWIEQKGRGMMNSLFLLTWDFHFLQLSDIRFPDSQTFALQHLLGSQAFSLKL